MKMFLQKFLRDERALTTVEYAVAGGLIVGDALFSTELGMIVGGALGGYLAHVWYSGRQIEVHVGNAPKI